MDACDHAGTKLAVHSIRGMAANVGAMVLAQAAGELERLLGEHRERPEQLSDFRSLIVQTLSVVERALTEHASKIASSAAVPI